MSICLSIYLFACLTVCLSACLSIDVSIYLALSLNLSRNILACVCLCVCLVECIFYFFAFVLYLRCFNSINSLDLSLLYRGFTVTCLYLRFSARHIQLHQSECRHTYTLLPAAVNELRIIIITRVIFFQIHSR